VGRQRVIYQQIGIPVALQVRVLTCDNLARMILAVLTLLLVLHALYRAVVDRMGAAH